MWLHSLLLFDIMTHLDIKYHNALNIIMPYFIVYYTIFKEYIIHCSLKLSWDKCECVNLVNNALSKVKIILKLMFPLTARTHIMDNINEITYSEVIILILLVIIFIYYGILAYNILIYYISIYTNFI